MSKERLTEVEGMIGNVILLCCKDENGDLRVMLDNGPLPKDESKIKFIYLRREDCGILADKLRKMDNQITLEARCGQK